MESLAGLPALGRSTRPSHPLLRAVALGGCCKLAQHGGASAAASLAANQRSCDHQSAARPALPFSAPPLPDFSPGAGHLQLSPGIRPKPSQTSTPRSRVSSRKQPQDTAHAARVTAPGEPRDLAQCSCIQVLPAAAAASRSTPRTFILPVRIFSRRPFQARPTPSRRASCKADLTHHQQGSPTRHSSHRRTLRFTQAASLVLSCSIVPATPSRVTRNKSRLIGYGNRR